MTLVRHPIAPVVRVKGLAYVCQRCGDVIGEPHAEPEVALRRAVETGNLHTFHRCDLDGGTGICRLVGTATEHATAAQMLAAGRATA